MTSAVLVVEVVVVMVDVTDVVAGVICVVRVAGLDGIRGREKGGAGERKGTGGVPPSSSQREGLHRTFRSFLE